MCGRTAVTLDGQRYRQRVVRQLPSNHNSRAVGGGSNSGSTNSGNSNTSTRAAAPSNVQQQQLSTTTNSNQSTTTTNQNTCAQQQQDNNINWIDEACYKPIYNAGPTTPLPVVYYQKAKDSIVLHTMKWGLYPSYVKDLQQAKGWSSNLINARTETVMEKAMFKNLVTKGRRGVCFVNGYYEWEQNKSKQAYFIQEKDPESNLLALACLYDIWKCPDGKMEDIYTFCVLTTDSKGSDVENIHHRCVIILKTPEEIELWLTADASKPKQLDMLTNLWKPLPKDQLSFYKVSNYVNSTANNSSKCMQKLEAYRAKNTLHRFFKPAVVKSEEVKSEEDVCNKRSYLEMKQETDEQPDEPVLKRVKIEDVNDGCK